MTEQPRDHANHLPKDNAAARANQLAQEGISPEGTAQEQGRAGQQDRALLEQWDRRHVWHAFTPMSEYEPLLLEEGEGCEVVDIDGRRMIDAYSSLWCNIHGHRHPTIDRAIREQLDRVAHVTNLGSSNSTTIRLARRLAKLAPGGLEHVFFSGDGASAVEVALKMTFQYWRQREEPKPEKTLYIALGNAYHGDTLGAVSVGGVERFHAMFRPLLFDVLRLPAPDSYRAPPELPGPVTPEQLARHHLAALEEVLARDHERIAAMVIEPLVQGAAGMIMHPPGYLRGAAELCRRHDVLLIADEVAVGFGRTGTMFACQQEGVVPDFLCLGKGLSGGYLPMAATITNDEVYRAFLGAYAAGKTFFHGHSYGGNPLSAAAALGSLEVFEQERTLEQLPAKIARLEEQLRRLAELPHVGNVRQRGLIAAVELVRDKETGEPFPPSERRAARVCHHAREAGVLTRPLGDVIVVMPPLAISLEQIDRIAAALESGIRHVGAE